MKTNKNNFFSLLDKSIQPPAVKDFQKSSRSGGYQGKKHI
jgi:hypothetical protein